MERVDRRRFIQKAGVTTAVAGGLWVAPSVLGFNTAWAGASCLNHATIAFSTAGSTVLPASYNLGHGVTATPSLVATGGPTPGAWGVNQLTTQNVGGSNHQFLVYNMVNGARRGNPILNAGYDVTFTFTGGPVYQVTFTIIDIDAQNDANGYYADEVWLTATGTNTTFTTSAVGTTFTGAGTAGNAWVGDATSSTASGNVTVEFAGPITSFTISYRGIRPAGANQNSLTNQYIGVNDISLCF